MIYDKSSWMYTSPKQLKSVYVDFLRVQLYLRAFIINLDEQLGNQLGVASVVIIC